MTYLVKNWDEFQHYKHRDPPWIRLYRKLLNDREWDALSGDDAKMLVNLWLLASEKYGHLPSIEDIAFRLRMPKQQVSETLGRLSEHWLLEDASKE